MYKAKVYTSLVLMFVATLAYSQTIINAEKYFQPDDTAFFAVSAEYAGNRGNSIVDQLDVSIATGYRLKSHTFKLMGGYLTLLKNNEKILNGGYMQVRHNFAFLNKSMKTFAFYQLQFNDILLLTKRELVGAGVRGHLVAKGDDFLDAGTGAIYEVEQLYPDALLPGETSLTKYYRLSNVLSFRLSLNERIGITNVFYYQPWFGDFTDFRVLDDFAIDFEVAENLAVSLFLVYRYDSDPPAALKQEDLDVGTALTLKF
jgi:hypothetical protein